MCCHTEMPCRRHRTWHPTPSQYRHRATCRCAIHWCGTSHWNTQLPILMSWVRPNWEKSSPTFHTLQRMLNLMLLWWLTVGSSVESTVPTGSWTRDLWCANPLRYPLTHMNVTSVVNNFAKVLLTSVFKKDFLSLNIMFIKINKKLTCIICMHVAP